MGWLCNLAIFDDNNAGQHSSFTMPKIMTMTDEKRYLTHWSIIFFGMCYSFFHVQQLKSYQVSKNR